MSPAGERRGGGEAQEPTADPGAGPKGCTVDGGAAPFLHAPAVVVAVGPAGGCAGWTAGLRVQSTGPERRKDGGRREGEARTGDRLLEKISTIRQRVMDFH